MNEADRVRSKKEEFCNLEVRNEIGRQGYNVVEGNRRGLNSTSSRTLVYRGTSGTGKRTGGPGEPGPVIFQHH